MHRATTVVDWQDRTCGHLSLDQEMVHIWRIDLAGVSDWQALKEHLSLDECARAERFRFERHQRRFAVGRYAVREILAGYLGIGVSEVCFHYEPRGKPFLSAIHDANLSFNVTHSGDLALLAVSRLCDIGIDVEAVERKSDIRGIARRFFASRELQQLETLPEEAFIEGFYHCWTRKEAYIKALGDGMAIPLGSFGVSVAAVSPASLLFDEHRSDTVSRWTFSSFIPADGFIASLATCGLPEICYFQPHPIEQAS